MLLGTGHEWHLAVGLPALPAAPAPSAPIQLAFLDGAPAALEELEGIERHRDTAVSSPESREHGTMVACLIKRGLQSTEHLPRCSSVLHSFSLEVQGGAVSVWSFCEALAAALERGVSLVNVSVTVRTANAREEKMLAVLIELAARLGVLLVIAANETKCAATTFAHSHWPIFAVAEDESRGVSFFNTPSLNDNGLLVPCGEMTALAVSGQDRVLSGHGYAAALATVALTRLRAAVPEASPSAVRGAIRLLGWPRKSVAPPRLDCRQLLTHLRPVEAGRARRYLVDSSASKIGD